ncbi:CHRD domain-containing protein [Anaerobaca lacustris]|uniref:CHRD domain-containing protein n=1 Tax=Anaerobaca lacustris TaxID=3044600 RepID=A0AAW6TQ29_9BACT|nr:CHRD domain-containing protein [Sedimentisphaerales bacterium M17dextr]
MNAVGIARKVCLLVAATALVPTLAPAQSLHVAWTFGDVGLESYRLDAFAPDNVGFPPLGSEDPTLPLELGRRYQVTITDYTFHPFEVIAKGPSASQDTVLLSMTVPGPFESDPEVAWTDDGRGTVAFTLTEALYRAMAEGGRNPGYRCRTHPTTMRGDFTVAGLPIGERIAPSPVRVALEPVASGLTAPLLLVPDPSVPARLYVVDQTGQIHTVEDGVLAATPLLDVSDLLVPLRTNFDERGLLGLAFHPGYADADSPGSGLFYTYTSEPLHGPADFTVDRPAEEMDHQSVIREWQAGAYGQPIDPTVSREVLRIDQPQFNHDGGHIEFGPDGYLYIALGDGGGANDTSPGHGPEGNGQNIHTILGSIVRIDPLDPDRTPDSPDATSANGAYRVPADNPFVGGDGVDEIYAYGLRNPYRFSFDRRSGALIVADVGQRFIEEINFVQKGGNYGWNRKEGSFLFDPAGVNVGLPLDDPTLIDPVAQYDHDDGIAVIGGYAYYGTEIPELWGHYLFGDWSLSFSTPSGRLFEADLFTGRIQYLQVASVGDPLGLFVKGFGQDAEGEVYLLGNTDGGPTGETGVVLKIVAAPTEFTADLSAEPAGADVTATGQARFTLDPNAAVMSYQLDVDGIVDVTQAHIHVANEPGGDGPPAVWLYPSAPPTALIPGEFSGRLGEGAITDADFVGPLAGMTMDALLTAIREGRAYVNVHTIAFPGGAIRGAVEAVRAAPPIGAVLTGAGDGTDSTATGLTLLRWSAEDTLSYELKVQALENVTQAHIHVANEPGGDGPPAVWLYPSAPPAALIPGTFTGRLGAGDITDADLVGPLAGMTVADLLSAIEEGRAYVNVHTERFPAGEIRGPLE